jgi:PAP2 superfamily
MQALYHIYWIVGLPGSNISNVVDERTYDLYLFFVDGSFGFEPSILARHAIDRVGLTWFFNTVYTCLPLAMAIAYISHLKSKAKVLYIPAVLAVAIAGGLFFHLLPACGPIYLLGTSKFAGDCGELCANTASILPDLTSYSFDPRWPRNAIPSLHVTWAILIFWICRDLKWGRWIAGAFLVCTALSTMVIGEHYLVDVIAAFPLALAVWSLCVGSVPLLHPRRMLPLSGALAALVIWMLAIRSAPQVFWLTPILPWGLGAALVVLPLLFVSRHPNQEALPTQSEMTEPLVAISNAGRKP